MKFKLFFFILFGLLALSACQSNQPKLTPLKQGDIILAFGDSLTYGVGVGLPESYPSILQNMIGHPVINAGVPGEETSGSLLRIKTELEKNHPQLVLVCIGGNDLLRKRPLEQIKENLKQIIQIIQQAGIQVILIAVPQPGLLLTPPDLYEELGNELNVPVLNNTISTLLGKAEYKSDYIHFNAMGYQMFAREVADFLKKQGAL